MLILKEKNTVVISIRSRKITRWDFPGSPEVKTPCFHCTGLIPGRGTKMPRDTAKK